MVPKRDPNTASCVRAALHYWRLRTFAVARQLLIDNPGPHSAHLQMNAHPDCGCARVSVDSTSVTSVEGQVYPRVSDTSTVIGVCLRLVPLRVVRFVVASQTGACRAGTILNGMHTMRRYQKRFRLALQQQPKRRHSQRMTPCTPASPLLDIQPARNQLQARASP